MLHDTDKGVVICNSSRGDEIRVLRPLQEYSWKIRILSLPRLCQTRGHEEVFWFAQGSYRVMLLVYLPAQAVFEVPQPEVVPYE